MVHGQYGVFGGGVIDAISDAIIYGAEGLCAWATERVIWGATTWAVSSLWGIISASLTSVWASICVFAWVAIPIVIAGALATVCIKRAILSESTSTESIRQDILTLAYDELVNKSNKYFLCSIFNSETGEVINELYTFFNDSITRITDPELIEAIMNASNSYQLTAPQSNHEKKAVVMLSIPVCMLN